MSLNSQLTTATADSGTRSRRRPLRDELTRPGPLAALIGLSVIVLMALLAPVLTNITGHGPLGFNEDKIDPMRGGLPLGPFGGISAEHWFGVEPLNGRDIFARIVFGARTSLMIAVLSALVATALGAVLGVLAGFFGGVVDTVISRLMDFLMAFPALIFMIAVLSAIPGGNRVAMLIVVMAVFGWSGIGRVVRSQAMSIASMDYVEAAKASGASRFAIVFKEVLPNVLPTIVVMGTLAIPTFIATEAGLSFLGVGIQPPHPSWGQMIASAVSWYASDPMFFIIPGVFLTVTVLCCMVLGDALQRALTRGTR